ncbi:MAG: hypothetical protein ACK4KW_08765 [Gemmobacter sp.]
MGSGSTANTVQTFWYGGPLSAWEMACLASFAPFGHDLHVYSYDRTLVLPPGAMWRDAGEILPESEVFFYRDGFGRGSVSAFANLFRYALLRDRGGWWVDTDVLCLGRLPASGEGAVVGMESPGRVNSAVIYAPPRHPLPTIAAREALALGKDVRWGNAGPHLMTRLCLGEAAVDGVSVLPATTFYPIHWRDVVPMLMLPSRAREAEAACRNASALHLYNEIFRRRGITKQKLPPEGSWLRSLFERHHASGTHMAAHTALDVRRATLSYYARRAREKLSERLATLAPTAARARP